MSKEEVGAPVVNPQTSFSFVRAKGRPGTIKEANKNTSKLSHDYKVKVEEEKQVEQSKAEKEEIKKEMPNTMSFHFNQKAKKSQMHEEDPSKLSVPEPKPDMTTSVNELTVADMGDNYDDDNDYPFDDGWKCTIV
eukprot:TRINITY_DN7024_c0_g3_i1.p2 TRINITY_DN7024_c0_g3~~TRINITY_DN7024_c0_g3_i1.p2  ORF type:complete len:135 (+),score=47.56 TRINITY_DN7024_c0_g3_i1:646-1050(+)